jgi:hypothetical protein
MPWGPLRGGVFSGRAWLGVGVRPRSPHASLLHVLLQVKISKVVDQADGDSLEAGVRAHRVWEGEAGPLRQQGQKLLEPLVLGRPLHFRHRSGGAVTRHHMLQAGGRSATRESFSAVPAGTHTTCQCNRFPTVITANE